MKISKKINLWLSTDNSQQSTDFGYAVPELVEGITLGTSTGSVTEQHSTKKRRINNPILFLGFVDTSLLVVLWSLNKPFIFQATILWLE
ncbi:MAG: hypothetical protein IKW54_01485 [Bacteroidales bacterium]|nr:hypothetical protein [Bacteroidales bacterium]